MKWNNSKYEVKFADKNIELLAVHRLRYRVFNIELGARTSNDNHKKECEIDAFDDSSKHLILIDKENPDPLNNVVGVYRLLPQKMANSGIGFYSACEYNLDVFIKNSRKILELGRSCIAKTHRGGVALAMLWHALSEYIELNQIEVLFGVASFQGTDISKISHGISYLHHKFLAPKELRAIVHKDGGVAMDIIPICDINRVVAMQQIPPLIKSYLRLGGRVGQGAYIDKEFNSIDVCMVLDLKKVPHNMAYNLMRRDG